MSTGTIVAIVIIALIVIAILAFVMPRMRARSEERKLDKRRGRAAEGHRDAAEHRTERARMAEAQAQRERAEAELHQSRAQMHEQGLADDELEDAPEPGRFERERETERTPEGERTQ
jgi:flagellar biosynthesis/type III secretory pathway M-ring protein FliF/YscJ